MRVHLRRLTLALTVALAACDRGGGGTPAGTAIPSGSGVAPAPAPLHPTIAVARDAASQALVSVRAVRAGLAQGGIRGDYLSMRRAIACGAPYWFKLASTFVEPLLGPRRSTDEAGGSLALLDRALTQGDDVHAQQQLAQIERALRVIEDGIGGRRITSSATTDMLGDAAYELGLLALEATAGVPDGHDAVLADLQGTIDGIERGADALAAIDPAAMAPVVPEAQARLAAVRALAAELRAKLEKATSSLDLVDRASFVQRTGALGVEIRRLGRSLGATPRLPYPARYPTRGGADDEPISALTLPAPRRALAGDGVPDPALVRLGERLFRETRLSKNDARSCASCHDPARAFADALVRPRTLVPGGEMLRHTPSLLYAPLAAVQMWDGRTLTPEAQAKNVIHAAAEMGITEAELVDKLSAVAHYRDEFVGMSGGLSVANVARALVAYEVAVLVPGSAPIDRFARGEAQLSADERAGLDVFAGKARCARCHLPPSFGGSRPRDFAVPVFAAIGVPTAPERGALDPDRGRWAVTQRAADDHAFKTPTVRNVSRTAPYFHNGAFSTLEQVVDFYDKGGGRAMGLRVENQDPEVRPLRLRPEERRVLLAFMRTALRDAAGK